MHKSYHVEEQIRENELPSNGDDEIIENGHRPCKKFRRLVYWGGASEADREKQPKASVTRVKLDQKTGETVRVVTHRKRMRSVARQMSELQSQRDHVQKEEALQAQLLKKQKLRAVKSKLVKSERGIAGRSTVDSELEGELASIQ